MTTLEKRVVQAKLFKWQPEMVPLRRGYVVYEVKKEHLHLLGPYGIVTGGLDEYELDLNSPANTGFLLGMLGNSIDLCRASEENNESAIHWWNGSEYERYPPEARGTHQPRTGSSRHRSLRGVGQGMTDKLETQEYEVIARAMVRAGVGHLPEESIRVCQMLIQEAKERDSQKLESALAYLEHMANQWKTGKSAQGQHLPLKHVYRWITDIRADVRAKPKEDGE